MQIRMTKNFYPVYRHLTDLVGIPCGVPGIRELIVFHVERLRNDDGYKAFSCVDWHEDGVLRAYSVEHGATLKLLVFGPGVIGSSDDLDTLLMLQNVDHGNWDA